MIWPYKGESQDFQKIFCCFEKEVINFIDHAMRTMPSDTKSHEE